MFGFKRLTLITIFCGGYLIVASLDRVAVQGGHQEQLLEQPPSADTSRINTLQQDPPMTKHPHDKTDKNQDKELTHVPEIPSCGKRKSRANKEHESEEIEDDAMGLDGSLHHNHGPLQLPSIVNTKNDSGGRKFLVATLDGRVTMLDQSGQELWFVHTGKLFSSTISSIQLSENGKWVNLIPSLTGGLYKYDQESLLPMPLNVDSLLQKSFKLSQDVVMTGGKELRTFGIDLKTGRVRYDCGISGCLTPNVAELEESPTDDERVTLIVKKQLQTVRAIDSQNGHEKWNFSVGTHELGLAGMDKDCYEEEQKEGGTLNYVKVIIPEGRLLSAHPESHTVWDKKFESPIAQAWVLENGRLIYVDPIQNTPLKEGPLAIYVGQHNQQFYVQESQSVSNKLENLLAGYGPRKRITDVSKPLKIGWRPSFPAEIGEDTDSEPITALTPLSTVRPIIQPFYVLDRDEIISDESGEYVDANNSTPLPDEDLLLVDDENQQDEELEEEEEELGPIGMINEVFIGSLWYWWKEVLGISLLTAVILNILLMKPLMRYVRVQTVRDTVRFVQDWANRNQVQIPKEDDEQTMQLVPVENVSLQSATGSSGSTTTIVNRPRTISDSFGNQFPLPSAYEEYPEQQEILYVSQYLREFEPVQCLGKGGFGVVYEAKKKIDDRNYAVKRITLPNREEARIRVMREVKALAQLDHRNIVRYFNAWIENPPLGWLEKNDPLWGKCAIGSLSPTVENASDFPSQMSSMMKHHYTSNKSFVSEVLHSNANLAANIENDSFDVIFDENASLLGNMADGDCSIQEIDTVSSSSNIHKTYQKKLSTTIEVSSGDSSTGGNGFWNKSVRSATASTTSWDKLSTSEHNKEISFSSTKNRVVFESEVFKLDKFEEEEEVSDAVEVAEEAQEKESFNLMFLYIQQELCQKRTLRDWLREEKQRELKTVVNFFGQIVDAVEYVHSKKLIHRDLKPSNIFLAGDIGPDDHVLKIGDFGLATTAISDVSNNNSSGRPALLGDEKDNLTSQVGTHLYMSPEQFQRKPYDYKVDIYSLGLIFFELLVPFGTEMERHEAISKLRKLRIPPDFQKRFPSESALIQTMISHNPHHRPDATAISQWVKSHLRSVEDTVQLEKTDVHATHRSNSSPGHIFPSSPDNSNNTKSKRRASERHRFQRTRSATTM